MDRSYVQELIKRRQYDAAESLIRASLHTADSWEKYYELGRIAFLRKRWKRANVHISRAMSLDLHRPEGWMMLGLTSAKLGELPSAIAQIQTYLDLEPDNCCAQFCADVFNRMMLDLFFEKTGKRLSVFDDEIVYTTEDEVEVVRGTELEPLKFRKELDYFWKGLVMGQWDRVKAQYGISDDEVKRYIDYTQYVLSAGFRSIEIRPGERVLEIGSGSGRILHVLAQHGHIGHTVATDVAVHELRGVKACLHTVHDAGPIGYVGLLVDHLPFKRNSFDVILIMDVVEHLYHDEFVRLLEAIREILRPSGRVYIQTPNGLRYMGKICRLRDGTLNVPEMNGNWQHVAEKTMGYLKKTLHECGYRITVLNRMRCVVKATLI